MASQTTFFLFALLALLLGCGASDTDETRDIEFRVGVGHDSTSATIDRVTYQITGATLGGSVAGDLVLVEAEPLSSWVLTLDLPNDDYEMQLVVWDDTGESFCTGSRHFGVHPTSETFIDSSVLCVANPPNIGGGPDEEGQFTLIYGNLCPQDVELAATPSDNQVGEPFALLGSAVDPEEEPLTYEWSATAGTLSILPEGSATFVCESPGMYTLTLSVSDGDPDCDKQRTVDVLCTSP